MRTDQNVGPLRRSRAKAMRAEPTQAERRLWRLLRSRQLCALKFRRQVPIGPYIVDFLCFEKRLVVEADGGQHGDNRYGERRDTFLSDQGWTVLQFWNHEILDPRQSVLDTILAPACLSW